MAGDTPLANLAIQTSMPTGGAVLIDQPDPSIANGRKYGKVAASVFQGTGGGTANPITAAPASGALATGDTFGVSHAGADAHATAAQVAALLGQAPAAASGNPVASDIVMSGTGTVTWTMTQIAAIVAQINGGGGGATTPAPTPPATGANLTMTGATYAAAPSGFGQQLTGGSGTAAVNMPAGDFTLELWFTGPAVTDTNYHMLACVPGTDISIALTNAGKFHAGGAHSSDTSQTVADGTRHHLAYTGNIASNVGWVHVDGQYVQFVNAVSSTAGNALSLAAAGGSVTTNGNTLTGWGTVDEVRLSKVNRYGAASFTVSPGPFTVDANTVGLWHLDGSGASA